MSYKTISLKYHSNIERGKTQKKNTDYQSLYNLNSLMIDNVCLERFQMVKFKNYAIGRVTACAHHHPPTETEW